MLKVCKKYVKNMEYFTNEVRKVRENFQKLDAHFFSNQYLAVP